MNNLIINMAMIKKYPLLTTSLFLSWIVGNHGNHKTGLAAAESALNHLFNQKIYVHSSKQQIEQQHPLPRRGGNLRRHMTKEKDGLRDATLMISAEIPVRIGNIPPYKMNTKEQESFVKIMERFLMNKLVQSSSEIISVHVSYLDQTLEMVDPTEEAIKTDNNGDNNNKNVKQEINDNYNGNSLGYIRSDPSKFMHGRLDNNRNLEKVLNKTEIPSSLSSPSSSFYLVVDTLVKLEYQPLLVPAPASYFHEMIPNVIDEYGNDMIKMLQKHSQTNQNMNYFSKVVFIDFVSYFVHSDGMDGSRVEETGSAVTIFLITFFLLTCIVVLGLFIWMILRKQRRARGAEEELRSGTILEARKRFEQAELEAKKNHETKQRASLGKEQNKQELNNDSRIYSTQSQSIDEPNLESSGGNHNTSAYHTALQKSNATSNSQMDDNRNDDKKEQDYDMPIFTIGSLEESLDSVHLDAKSVESVLKKTAISMVKLTKIFYGDGKSVVSGCSTQFPEDDKRSEGSSTARHSRGRHQDLVGREEVPLSPHGGHDAEDEGDNSTEAWISTEYRDEEDSLSAISDSSVESMPSDCYEKDANYFHEDKNGEAPETPLSRLFMNLEDISHLHQEDDKKDHYRHDPTWKQLQIHDYYDRPLRECYAPPGNLGLTFRSCQKGGLPIVSRINRNSPLHGFIQKGESILAIADESAEGLSATDLTNLLKKRTDGTRKLTVLGVVSPTTS